MIINVHLCKLSLWYDIWYVFFWMNIILYSEYSYRFVSTFSLPFLRQNHRLQFHYIPTKTSMKKLMDFILTAQPSCFSWPCINTQSHHTPLFDGQGGLQADAIWCPTSTCVVGVVTAPLMATCTRRAYHLPQVLCCVGGMQVIFQICQTYRFFWVSSLDWHGMTSKAAGFDRAGERSALSVRSVTCWNQARFWEL